LPVLRPAQVVGNRYALAAVGLTAGLQVLAAQFQPLARVLRMHALVPADWLVIAGLSLVPAVLGQTIKMTAAARRRRSISALL
jgi:hypothetical protein